MLRRRDFRSMSAAVAAAMLLMACGPSEEEVFEAAMRAARNAIAADDLVAAESFLRDAREIRPEAGELAQASSEFAAVKASAELFRDAEELVSSAQLLGARQLYLGVPPEDVTRYAIAQERALSIEQDWVADAERLIERRIFRGDLEEALRSIREVQRGLAGTAILEELVARLVNPLVELAEAVSREHLSEGDFGAAELALRNAISVLGTEDASVATRMESVRQEIGVARERSDSQRREEALARQRSGSIASGAPRVPAPVVPAVRMPETVPGPDGRGCPSPAVDVEGWRECVFGGRSDIVVPPPSTGPVAPVVPDASARGAAREAEREAARMRRILELRSVEERVLREYQRLWTEQNAAQIDYQRRIRDFDTEINLLLREGQSGAAAIETMRRQQFMQADQGQRGLRTERIEAAERELAAVREELQRIS